MIRPATNDGGQDSPPTIRVWDPFVRLFHWSVVVLFVTAWLSGDAWGDLHDAAGYGLLGFVGLRILWGVFGHGHARFSAFVRGPGAVLAYLRDTLRGSAPRYLGHNPAGGAMILALLALLAVICGTGIMMGMDAFWGEAWVENVHVWATNLTIGLILLHIAGVVVASVEHRENLVKSMFTGRKRTDDTGPSA